MSSLFVIIFALCISIAVNANLTKSFLMCTGKEELFRCFPAQQFFMIFFSGLTFRISMPPLARLGLSSRAHFGARSEQCTTWPPGTCSSQSRSSIGPSSSLEEGRSWCQVIIENGHCIVCYLYATSHQIKKASLRRREKEEKKATTSPHRSHLLLGSLRCSTKQITYRSLFWFPCTRSCRSLSLT